jgi:hypothetical protein
VIPNYRGRWLVSDLIAKRVPHEQTGSDKTTPEAIEELRGSIESEFARC